MTKYGDALETYVGYKDKMVKVPNDWHWKVPLTALCLSILIFFTGIFVIDLFFSFFYL